MVCGLLHSLETQALKPPGFSLFPPWQLRPSQGFLDHTVPDLASPEGAGLVAGHGSVNGLVGGTGYHPTVTEPQPPRPRPGPRRRLGPWALLSPSQHTEPWLQSDKSHERKRVAQTIFLLLKYVADYVTLTVSGLTQHPRWQGAGGGGRGKGGARRAPRALQLWCWTHLALAPGSLSQYSPSVQAARHGAGG